MRIAMLGHKRIPSREGGVEITIEQLAVRMVAQGHQVICYNRKGHHVSGKQFSSAQLLEHQGVQLKTVPAINLRGIAAMSASVFASIRAPLAGTISSTTTPKAPAPCSGCPSCWASAA